MKTDTPQTHYARSGAVHIAYQVSGEGSLDLVFVPGWVSHVELAWEIPMLARFLRRLGTFARVIRLDKRGTGLSDPVPPDQLPGLEQRMDDIRAVMDAVGSERAALLGVSEGGPMNLLFAATYPGRTAALVLLNTYARIAWADDYPWGIPRSESDRVLDRLDQQWGTGVTWSAVAPSLAGAQAERQAWARFQRMSASPAAAVALLRMSYETDVRAVLGAISVPTLVVHRAGDRFVPVANGRYLAERIHGARYVELPGNDHLVEAGDVDPMLNEVEEFLTGERSHTNAERVLATVLFADIVDSTQHAVTLGDRHWRDLLDEYHRLARRQVARFRGRELDTAGDGFLAAFDGPARAVHCACAIRDGTRGLGLEVRAGVHTGECEVLGDKLAGIAVHIGARVTAEAAAGDVLVSTTVKDLVAGSGLAFVDRGVHTLRGVPGEWRLFAVDSAPARG